VANGNNTANVGFEQQIWQAADILRGSMDAAEYKHVVLGLIFLKYISDKFEARYQELLADDDDVGDKDAYVEAIGFFVPPSARWHVISEAARKEGIGTVIDDAMRAIEKENKQLKDILPKNYARPELDKRRLGNVVDLFTNIQMIEHGADKDILGRTYEYCLAKFAEQEGKRAGEFYTPSCVVRTLVEVLQPFKGRVYDPCCGSGGMFVQSAEFVSHHAGNIGLLSVVGQDANPTTRKMALMNLAIRGIEADLGNHNADTFHNDLHPTLKADFILANPPFNLSDWNDGSLNDDPRWKYGLPPEGNANFAWMQHMIYHLAPNGKIGMVLANGSLSSQSGGEGEIRKKIVEDDLVEGIIAMPTQLFYTTQIPVSLWFISRNKAQKGKTLFIDARKMGTMVNRRLREMTADDIAKIAATFEAFDNMGRDAEGRDAVGGVCRDAVGGVPYEDVKGYCAAVTTAEIAKQDYILTPGRYVGIEEQADDGEPFEEKMARLTGELSEMFKRSHELEGEIRKRLGAIGYEV
jgi:type I restriction enzyme M protein